MTVTIDLAPGEEVRLREKASRTGQDVGDYLKSIALREVAEGPDRHDWGPAVGNIDPNGRVYDPAAAIMLLNTFAESDEYGTSEEQRETFEYLKKAIDEDRPGQRSIFGKGINPMSENDH